MSWRFHPLRDAPDCGLLVKSGGKVTPAMFITPKQAKCIAKRNAA